MVSLYQKTVNYFFKKPQAIGEPEKATFAQGIHISTDPDSAIGLKGLPKEWEIFLLGSGVSKAEIMKNADVVVEILNNNQNVFFGVPLEDKTPVPLPSKKEAEAHAVEWSKAVRVIDDIDKLYPVRTKIGEGGFGVVYVTQNKDANCADGLIALKCMKFREENKKGILNEVNVMHFCQKNHQIVRFFDAFQVKGVDNELWIAMEYLGGGSVTNLLTVQPELPDPVTAFILREMFLALAFLHKNHRIHRDIKSDNMLLGLNGVVKLADFGFCAQLTQEERKRKTMVGTPYWMSPELIQNQGTTESTDIWAMGVVAIECAEGEPPYLQIPHFKALYNIMSLPPSTLKEPDKHSPLLADLISKCLVKDPTQRATAEQLLEHPFLKLACKPEDLKPFIQKSRAALKPEDGK